MHRHDQFSRCTCGHIAGLHAADDPKPCRLCNCQRFMTNHEQFKFGKEEDDSNAR